jgi:uncharacterized membrane protein YraQ (UPF0718 family)
VGSGTHVVHGCRRWAQIKGCSGVVGLASSFYSCDVRFDTFSEAAYPNDVARITLAEALAQFQQENVRSEELGARKRKEAESWGLTGHLLMRCPIVSVPMMAGLAMKSLLAPIGVAFCYNSPWHGIASVGISSMLRRLLNIASIVCVVTCVALTVLWVRSYSCSDDINTRLGPYHGLEVRSSPGLLDFEQYSLGTPSVWPATMSSVENKGYHVSEGRADESNGVCRIV